MGLDAVNTEHSFTQVPRSAQICGSVQISFSDPRVIKLALVGRSETVNGLKVMYC